MEFSGCEEFGKLEQKFWNGEMREGDGGDGKKVRRERNYKDMESIRKAKAEESTYRRRQERGGRW